MRSRAHWIAVATAAAALLLSACSDSGQRKSKGVAPFTAFDALTVEQSACYRGCPAFEVKIFADGRVRHSGPEFEFTGGAHASRIDRRGLDSIAAALRTARLDEMRDRYRDKTDGCDIYFMDASTLSIGLTRARGYRNKSVELYTGCLGPRVPTTRIGELIDAIDKVTGTAALLKQREESRPKDGEKAGKV